MYMGVGSPSGMNSTLKTTPLMGVGSPAGMNSTLRTTPLKQNSLPSPNSQQLPVALC